MRRGARKPRGIMFRYVEVVVRRFVSGNIVGDFIVADPIIPIIPLTPVARASPMWRGSFERNPGPKVADEPCKQRSNDERRHFSNLRVRLHELEQAEIRERAAEPGHMAFPNARAKP